MSIMYGPDGQKQWVWPWQEDEFSSRGWSTEPLPLPSPRRWWQSAPLSPLQEATRLFTEVQEPIRNAQRPGWTRKMAEVTEVSTPHWVGTDMNGRPVYEIVVTNASGEHSSRRRYALDTTSVRGLSRFVEPAEMLQPALPDSKILLEQAQSGPSDPSSPLAAASVPTARIMRLLASGAINADAARGALKRLGLADPQISTIMYPPGTLDPKGQPIYRVLEGLQRGAVSARDTRDSLLKLGLDEGEAKEVLARWMRGDRGSAASAEDMTLQEILASMFGDSGGGYGPRYTAPDRELVKDSVRGLLIALVGHADPGRIDSLTDLYLRDDYRAFRGASVDPSQSVRAMIRGYDDYKRVHQLRPEQVDEMDWIPTQASQLMQAGVRSGEIDQRAVIQAQVGTAPARAGEAAFISEFQQTSRPLPEFFKRFKDAAASSFGRVA